MNTYKKSLIQNGKLVVFYEDCENQARSRKSFATWSAAKRWIIQNCVGWTAEEIWAIDDLIIQT